MNRTDLKYVLRMLNHGNIDRARGYLTKKLEDLEAKQVKLGKLVEIEVSVKDGFEKVKAFPVGKHFAVHKCNDYGRDWTVTHIPSGLSAAVGVRRKNLAVLYAKAFGEVGLDWSEKEPLRGASSEAMDDLKELSRAARDNEPVRQ